MPEATLYPPPTCAICEGASDYSQRETLCNESICSECAEDWLACTDCGRFTEYSGLLTTTSNGRDVCDRCRDRNYHTCYECDETIPDGEYCDCEDDSGGCTCSSCTGDYDDDESDSYGVVFGYDYKPVPVFHGEGPLYLGLELEVEASYLSRDDCTLIARNALDELGYLKSDGSLTHGFEIVTHPMSHEYAASSFPWGMLDQLARSGASADDTAGLHVHVSRDAFAGPAHVYRWLKLIYRNEDNVTAIARRRSEQWAPFSASDRENVKDYAKGSRYADRYAAVNVTNDATFELRVFASSLDKREVLAALDLAAASVEYTRTLTVADIARRGGWNWDAFTTWVDSQPEYAALSAEAGALCAC